MMPGFRHIKGHLTRERQCELLNEIRDVIQGAPLYRPSMPRSGKPFSVWMTNSGKLGWVSDVTGYRYQTLHPETGRPWPPMPPTLIALWRETADWPGDPEACLVNYYAPQAKLGSHVDRDEAEFSAPVLSVSLGDDAVFHIGGRKRSDPKTRIILSSGDVVILGGEARCAHHGIDRVIPGTSSLLEEGGRFNLTLRRVTAYPG